jgi:hypothetical protein
MAKKTPPTTAKQADPTTPTKQGMQTDSSGKRIMMVRPRGSPTEELVASRDAAKRSKDGEVIAMDMSPALTPTEFAELQTIAKDSTAEQFQAALSQVLQKMIVTGLKDMPAPKSIKELESLIRLFRQTSGLEAKDKAGGGPSGGFLPRVVTRRNVGTPVLDIPQLPTDDPIPPTDMPPTDMTHAAPAELPQLTPDEPPTDMPHAAPAELPSFF